MTTSSKVVKIPGRLIALLFLALCTSQADAHTPHDGVAFLAVSPAYEEDKTLFVGVLAHLQRSIDGGQTWKRLAKGLDNKSRITGIALSPAFLSDSTVFVTTSGDGVYTSVDGGDSWRRLDTQPENLDLDQIVLSPRFAVDATILVMGKMSDLYLSTDGGDSWETIFHSRGPVQNPLIVYEGDVIRILALVDNGVAMQRFMPDLEWQPIPELPADGLRLLRRVERYDDVPLLIAASDSAIYVSDDLGKTFDQRNLPDGGLGGEPGRITAADAAGRALIVTGWHGGAYVTDHGDNSWRATSRGLSKDYQADEHGRPHFSGVTVRGDTVFLSAFDGLFRSDDAGLSWRELETLPAGNPTSFDVIASDGAGDRLVVSTFDAGVYSSDDSGATWNSLNLGLADLHVWSVAIRPDAPGDSLLLAATNRSIYSWATHDTTWQKNMLGCKGELARRSKLEGAWDRAKYFFTGKPKCRATFPHEITFSSGQGGSVYFGTRYEGVFGSADNGDSWHNVHDAFGGWVSRIATTQNRQIDDAVFVSVRGKGVLRSTDHGKTWQHLANQEMLGIFKRNPNTTIPIAPSPDFHTDGRVFIGTPAGLFESADKGETWRRVDVLASGPGNAGVLAVALSPGFAQDGFLLVSIKGRGLYMSKDSARTFAPVAAELIDANHLLKRIKFIGEHETSQTVYALSDEELFVSSNRGESWQIVSPAPTLVHKAQPGSNASIASGN